VIRAGSDAERSKQGLDVFAGISRENTGAAGLCMHLVVIPPGAVGRAHLHRDHETTLYVISGTAEMRYGPELEHELSAAAGDFVYIPAGMPHLPANASDRPCVAVLARTDPEEQESVELLPWLDDATMEA
jgi:uncharacterized RmlC-like cupin family protein